LEIVKDRLFMNDDIFLTAEGIQKIRAELNHLKTTVRVELAQRLRAAIQMGDLSENADYISAKEEQGFIEGRIQELENVLKKAQVIEESKDAGTIISIGSKVIIKEEDYPEETFHIIGSKEADPQNGKISYESPIGKALLGHKVGDRVSVETPEGKIVFEILKIF
jgi:transcription elongation factor GreA